MTSHVSLGLKYHGTLGTLGTLNADGTDSTDSTVVLFLGADTSDFGRQEFQEG